MVVAAYGLILPKAVLDATRTGALNIHASLLPRWRGPAPVERAILAGTDGLANAELVCAYAANVRRTVEWIRAHPEALLAKLSTSAPFMLSQGLRLGGWPAGLAFAVWVLRPRRDDAPLHPSFVPGAS